MTQDTTISRTEGKWINDPETGRWEDLEAYWAMIEKSNFGYDMRQGNTPEQAYRNLEDRKKYIAYLKEHKSPLADD